MIKVSTPYGEVFDRITILQIRQQKYELSQDEQDRLFELFSATAHMSQWQDLQTLVKELKQINLELWDLEDEIRKVSAYKEVATAALDIIRKNDNRCKIKHKINQMTGTNHEKKVYCT